MSKLACIHRGERLEQRGTCDEGCRAGTKIPLSQCNLFNAPCSVAVKTKEGHHLCKTCGKRETKSEDTKPRPELVTVPEPPSLNLKPEKPRAVVTVAAGDEGKALLRLSRRWLEQYAARLDADFVVLDWLFEEQPIYSKFQLYRTLDHYERVAFLDADTLADPAICPDLFARVPPGHFGIYDDRPGLLANNAFDRFKKEGSAVRQSQEMPSKDLAFYGNTGVMVFDRSHREILAPPSRPIPRQHCGEQALWVARLQDSGAPITFLSDDCNRQWWENREFQQPQPPGAILHFSGIRPHRSSQERLDLMKEVGRRQGMIPPWSDYVICSIRRSGSSLLSRALADAGMGDPREYLNPKNPCEKTYAAIREKRCVKAHWGQLAGHKLLDESLIPNATYISVTRRNLVRQAVSLARALQTRQWTADQEKVGEAEYNRDLIEQAIRETAVAQTGWEWYFGRHGIQPLRVFYEDLEADFTGTVRKVLDYLGERNRPVPEPRLRKQADELNDQWVERFLRGE